MSYKELLYKNALAAIDKIYQESKYNEDVDFFRITDIINSVNENQIANKEWLVNELIPHMKEYPEPISNIHILGAWYGITSLLLREKWNKKVDIWNIDIDPMCKLFGPQLLGEHINTHFVTDDVTNFFIEKARNPEIVINTSCEHIEKEDILLLTKLKRKNSLGCYQSNNYETITSHINTSNSLDEFVEQLRLDKVVHTSELKRDDYTRYMVIGY